MIKSECKYYIPASYSVCATCQIGKYCNGICHRFTPKNEESVKMTEKGVSTIRSGEEKYEMFHPAYRPKETLIQYDYRTLKGQLFSCVKRTLEECRECRDKWLESINSIKRS